MLRDTLSGRVCRVAHLEHIKKGCHNMIYTRGEWKNFVKNSGLAGERVREYSVPNTFSGDYHSVVHYVTVHTLKRLNNSVNGNPRWSLLVGSKPGDPDPWHTTYQTQSDASVGYSIGYGLAGSIVDLYLSRGGRVIGVAVLGRADA